MSVSKHQRLHTTLYTDVECNATAELLTSSGVVVFAIEVNNEANSSAVFFKIYSKATAASVGSDDPTFVFKVPAGEKLLMPLGGDADGLTIATGLNIACVTTGGTTGSTAPTNKVTATIATA